MRRIWIVLLALLALAAAPVHAQAPAGETATEAAASSAGAPVSADAPTPAADAPSPAGAALPRYTPPRTLRAYAHVFVAFAVAWVLLFGYVVFLARKFRRVEEQVDALARS
ncbi:MAG TPA: CcmD family protein [Longimicrobium sp.]|nr:CcmD family protein [Longimicrobium sp.]